MLNVKTSDYVEKTVSHFRGGYNCAQSVLLTLQDMWDVKPPLEPKVASAFGGGIGRRGALCGALTGGVIAIGLKYGSNKPNSKDREPAYSLALEFYNRFEKDCSGVSCWHLIGFDLTNAKELESARNSNVFSEKCVHFIEKAIKNAIDITSKTPMSTK